MYSRSISLSAVHERLLAAGGYPPKAGHDVTSSTYGADLMAMSGQGQRLDLR